MKKPSFKTDINKFAAKIRNINNDFILNAKKETFFLKDRFNQSISKLKQNKSKILEIRKLTSLKKLDGRDIFNNKFNKINDVNKASLKTNIIKFTSKLKNINNNFISNKKKDIVSFKDRFNKSISKLKQKKNKAVETRKLTDINKSEDYDVFNNMFDKKKSNEINELQNINELEILLFLIYLKKSQTKTNLMK